MVKPELRCFLCRIAPRWHIKGFFNSLSPGLLGCSFEYETWNAVRLESAALLSILSVLLHSLRSK